MNSFNSIQFNSIQFNSIRFNSVSLTSLTSFTSFSFDKFFTVHATLGFHVGRSCRKCIKQKQTKSDNKTTRGTPMKRRLFGNYHLAAHSTEGLWGSCAGSPEYQENVAGHRFLDSKITRLASGCELSTLTHEFVRFRFSRRLGVAATSSCPSRLQKPRDSMFSDSTSSSSSSVPDIPNAAVILAVGSYTERSAEPTHYQ